MIDDFLINFKALYDNLTEMIIVVNDFGLILNMNNTASDVLSFSKDEMLNKSISEICCDKTLENIVKCSVNDFKTNLCTKYKQLIPVKGKLSSIHNGGSNLAILKLFKMDEEVYDNIYTNNKTEIRYSNFIKDVSGKYLFVNDVFEEYFKKDRKDILDKFDHDVWDDDMSYKVRREDLYVISTKNTYVSCNSQIIDDKVFYYEKSKSPVFDKNNKVIALIGNTRDITESVKLRNELVVQNEQLSIIYKILNNSSSKINLESLFSSLYKDFKTLLNVDSISVFLYNFDLENLEYCTSYGVSKSFMDSYVSTDICREFMYKVFRSKMPTPMTAINESNNDRVYYCACYPLAYNDVSFGVINFGCNSEEYSYSWDNKFMEAVCKNISILLQNAILYTQLEDNLKFEKEAHEQINLYFDTNIDFLCIIDESNHIKKVGKQMLETLGYSEEEMVHANLSKFVHVEDRHAIYSKINDSVHTESTEIFLRILCKNGEFRTVEWNVKYLKDRMIYVCSGRDLTCKIEMEQKKKFVEESWQLEKLKSEFLSSISHELRTPIAIIYGSINNIEINLEQHGIEIPERVKEYIGSVKKNAFRLLRLFNNILDITNVDAGLANVNAKVYNIVKVVEDISLSVSEHLADKGISLIFDTDVEEKYVSVDVGKMERVMLNLISNSVKHSKKNIVTEIFIKISETNDKVFISVKDNGIGIDPKYLSKIFDRFNHANCCMTKNTEGSGIGLYLVKTLLQMQGADIIAQSTEGEGSEFIIEFPALEDDGYFYMDENIDDDFSVKVENFDMEFSDISY